MAKEEKYRVVSSIFKGHGEDGSATYEITFNKSLEHTGRFDGIADGLNDYVKKEREQQFKSSFSNVWKSFIRLLKA